MISLVTLGNVCIGLSLGSCLLGLISFIVARKLQNPNLAALGRGCIYANFIFMTIANLGMIYGLLGDDFSVKYVAQVGSIETPRWVSAVSLWSSLEGSILFWGFILSTYSAVVTYVYRDSLTRLEAQQPAMPVQAKMMMWVGFVVLFVQLFFFFVLALPANPFLPMNPIPMNGPGPNPLLQNHWLMIIHPPCLYIGYIGMTIPFAFAIAALIEGDLPGEWLSFTRRWTLFAWSFLSMAIVLGGWWSYAVLGWGGYWAWDPVENASFMPWLTGTALLHSIIVQEKRKILSVWNLTLAIITFLLTLLGTFLTRSGVLDSVHSFTESHIGPYFLTFILLTLFLSVALLLWKGDKIRERGKFESLFSLEVLFLFNNLLFVSFCFIVFLGTLYPLIIEALQGKRLSVGEPYFDQMTIPIAGMILLLLSVGLATPWKKATSRIVIQKLKLAIIGALTTTLLSLAMGIHKPMVLCVIALSSLSLIQMLKEYIDTARKVSRIQLFTLNPRRYGGFVAHLGSILIILGITFSRSYEEKKEVTLKTGETTKAHGYEITFENLKGDNKPQRFEVKASMAVEKNGDFIETLWPQMNFYPVSNQPIGSPAIRSTWKEDLYITLMHFEKDGSEASFHIIYSPTVSWIWLGGILILVGGLIPTVISSPSKDKSLLET